MEHNQISDEELIKQYRDGDKTVIGILLDRYKPLVLKNTKSLYLVGGDRDDLIQEGMIGLVSAIGDFDIDAGVTFFHFADLCINRQLIKAIDSNNSKKHEPLNKAISIESSEDSDGDAKEDISSANPMEMIIDAEDFNLRIKRLTDILSPMEQKVFGLYMKGYDYHEIAQLLDKADKSIDNTLTRIRNKAKTL